MAQPRPEPDEETIDATRWTCPGVALVAIALVAVIAVACNFLLVRQ